MFDNLPLWPARASTTAGSVDALFIFLVALCTLVSVAIFAVIVVFGGLTIWLQDATFMDRVGRLTAEEQEVIFAAAIRREELGMEARLRLFAALGQRLQDDAGFFKPAQ